MIFFFITALTYIVYVKIGLLILKLCQINNKNTLWAHKVVPREIPIAEQEEERRDP